jgi:flagellar basal-body rod protein FlgB
MMKIFDTAFGIHEKALNLRAQRMEVISKNIANADTPGFKARDIDFKNVLNNVERAGTMQTTHAKHIGQAANAGSNMVYTVPFNTALDGNTVDISVEHAKYGKAAAEYQATLRFIEGNIAGVRKALRGE